MPHALKALFVRMVRAFIVAVILLAVSQSSVLAAQSDFILPANTLAGAAGAHQTFFVENPTREQCNDKRVLPGQIAVFSVKYDGVEICARITNNGAQAVFVPMATRVEYEGFLAHKPANVSLAVCAPDPMNCSCGVVCPPYPMNCACPDVCTPGATNCPCPGIWWPDTWDCECGDSNNCPCDDDRYTCACGDDLNSCPCGDDPKNCGCGDGGWEPVCNDVSQEQCSDDCDNDMNCTYNVCFPYQGLECYDVDIPDSMNCPCGDTNACPCGDSNSCSCGDSNSCPCGDPMSCACNNEYWEDVPSTCYCGDTCVPGANTCACTSCPTDLNNCSCFH